MGNSLEDQGGIVGEVKLECYGPDNKHRWTEIFVNKVTTPGDNYYTTRAIAAVAPNSPSDVASKVSCMKLGTGGATAEAKTGLGAGVVTYKSGTNVAFDTGYPQSSANVATYKTTFLPGVGTDSALSEIVIAITNNDATSASGDCIARAVISPSRNKQSGDTLVATWTHTFLGA